MHFSLVLGQFSCKVPTQITPITTFTISFYYNNRAMGTSSQSNLSILAAAIPPEPATVSAAKSPPVSTVVPFKPITNSILAMNILFQRFQTDS